MELNYDMILSFHNVSKFVYVLKFSSYSLHGAGNVLNALNVGKCWYKTLLYYGTFITVFIVGKRNDDKQHQEQELE